MDPMCDRFDNVSEVFSAFFPLWVLMLSVWCYLAYSKHPQEATGLHKVLTALPAVECLYTFLCIFYYRSCPWESIGSQLVAAVLLMVVILKEPLNLLCLLLVSKGWCITRETLGSGENRVLVISGVFLYASVVFQLFGNTVYWMIPILLAYIVLFGNVMVSIYTNLRVLKSQLLAIATFNISPATTPAYAKYRMFQRLACAALAYVLLELGIHLGTYFAKSPIWVFHLLHQAMELAIIGYVGHTFRVRPSNSVFHAMPEFTQEIAERLLPSITTVSISALELSGPNMMEWGKEAGDETPDQLVVVNPGADEATDETMAQAVQTAVPTAGGLPLAAARQRQAEPKREAASSTAPARSTLPGAPDPPAGAHQDSDASTRSSTRS